MEWCKLKTVKWKGLMGMLREWAERLNSIRLIILNPKKRIKSLQKTLKISILQWSSLRNNTPLNLPTPTPKSPNSKQIISTYQIPSNPADKNLPQPSPIRSRKPSHSLSKKLKKSSNSRTSQKALIRSVRNLLQINLVWKKP